MSKGTPFEASSSRQDQPVERWDIRTVFIRAEDLPAWGLTPNQIAIARRILGGPGTVNASWFPALDLGGSQAPDLGPDLTSGLTSGQVPAQGPEQTSPPGLSFAEFRALVSFVYKNARDVSGFGEAIESLSNQAAGYNIQALQQTLRSFFSLLGRAPFNIVVDGQMGGETGEALRYVLGAFHLPQGMAVPSVLPTLLVLSERIVRVRCTDDYILSKLEHNPFCIADNQPREHELRLQGNGIAVYDTSSNAELVRLPSFFAASGIGIEVFNRLSVWWALLRMQGGGSMGTSQILLQPSGKSQLSVEWLESGGKAGNFFQQPDRLLSLSSLTGTIAFDLQSSASWQGASLICVFFDAELRISLHTVVKGELSYDFHHVDAGGMTVNEAQFLRQANFLKIFVVKDFNMRAEAAETVAFPGIDVPDEYYALFEMPKENILYTATIGLRVDTAGQSLSFKNKWVLVVGTAKGEIQPAQAMMCKALGRELARAGYGLISGVWRGVDDLTVKAYYDALPVDALVAERVREIPDPNSKASKPKGKSSRPDEKPGKPSDLKGWNRLVFAAAHALILVGGGSGTERVYNFAEDDDFPILPIAATSGVAGKAFRSLEKNRPPGWEELDFTRLGGAVDSAETAAAMAHIVVDILDQLPPSPAARRQGSGNEDLR